MPMNTSVTLVTQQARATSNTRRGRGVVLDYEMVTGVQVEDRSMLTFTPPEYDRWAITGAAPGRRTIQLRAKMAARLERFVQVCLVDGTQGYDGFSFMDYLMGYTDSPLKQPERDKYEGRAVTAGRIALGYPYVIVNRRAMPIHGMLGLAPGLTFGVNGVNSALAVCPLMPLIGAYGGAGVFLVTGNQRHR